MNFRGQAARLTPEDQHHVPCFTKGRVPERSRGFGREEERVTKRRELFLEGCPGGPHAQGNVVPVIEAGALDLFFVKRKAQRLDQMKGCPGRQASPADIAGIPMDLWMNKDDVDASY